MIIGAQPCKISVIGTGSRVFSLDLLKVRTFQLLQTKAVRIILRHAGWCRLSGYSPQESPEKDYSLLSTAWSFLRTDIVFRRVNCILGLMHGSTSPVIAAHLSSRA